MHYLQGVHKVPLILIFLSVCSFAQKSVGSVKASSVEISSEYTDSTLLSSLDKIGEGQMKILFWKVYKAEFYAKNKSDVAQSSHKALKLTYQRNIEKKEFIDATEDQWNKLNQQLPMPSISKHQEKKWLEALNTIFPNITENDVILFTLSDNKQSNFYFKAFNKNNVHEDYILIGSITDPLFGEHFLSIWLSKYTSEPKLRKRLLGQ